MSRNGHSAADVPLVAKSGHEEEAAAKGWWWWKKALVLEVEEAKSQILFVVPMILTNFSYYCIPLVSVMFAGHLGELELAGSTLANSWVTVTGLALMMGLSGALETLCGHGYGSKLYKMLGIYLQASCMISVFFCIFISIIWWYTEPILTWLHQSPPIAKSAALYVKYHIPGLFAYGLVQNILRFLQTQSVVIPLVLCSVLPLIIHIGITYILVHHTALAFKGAALSVSISLWISLLMLAIYVLRSKKFEHTWEGFSLESFRYVLVNLELALPSAAMFCLEDWAYELLVLMAGLMPNSEITTSLVAMCVNTEAIAFMIAAGVSAAASTRVSNELGRGNTDRAKHAMAINLKISVLIALAVVLALAFGHNLWANLFSDSSVIMTEFASMTPLLIVSVLFDSFQGVLSGVARGCGWQHLAAFINFGSFYFVGTPIACLLALKFKLYAKGLWLGLVCGVACQTISLLLLTRCSKWNRVEFFDSSNKEHSVLV